MRRVLFVLLLALSLPGQARAYEQPELDALLAPIALYPDELVGHILVAAAYPQQVSDAARGAPAQPHWHPSVSALVSYPELLQRMAASPQWMHDLSQAYIHQQASVMVTVQALRTRAAAYGHLPPEPAPQQVVYVRYYDPYVVYGPWWWPAYRPVFWHPWHTHRVFIHRAAPVHRHPHIRPAPSLPLHANPNVGHVKPNVGHVKPYQRVPEAQRRPAISSTPQLRSSPPPRKFAGGNGHYKPR
jgi:hypothetical protein